MNFFARLAELFGFSRPQRSHRPGTDPEDLPFRPKYPARPGEPAPLAEPRMGNPQDILFSLPTINDALPVRTTGTPPTKETVLIHEDDWRQFEFVSRIHRDEVDKELKDIDQIWKTQTVKTGELTVFRTIHVRKRIGVPLALDFTEADWLTLLGRPPVSFAFAQHPQTLKDVIACRAGGIIFYAHLIEGKLVTFGLEREGAPSLDPERIARLGEFMTRNDLLLVHWPSPTLFKSPAAAANFFQGSGNPES
jgi:hypothetical protein